MVDVRVNYHLSRGKKGLRKDKRGGRERKKGGKRNRGEGSALLYPLFSKGGKWTERGEKGRLSVIL